MSACDFPFIEMFIWCCVFEGRIKNVKEMCLLLSCRFSKKNNSTSTSAYVLNFSQKSKSVCIQRLIVIFCKRERMSGVITEQNSYKIIMILCWWWWYPVPVCYERMRASFIPFCVCTYKNRKQKFGKCVLYLLYAI